MLAVMSAELSARTVLPKRCPKCGERFPPEEIRWFATSGIIVTSEPVRDRIIALTRSMSARVSPTSGSMPPS